MENLTKHSQRNLSVLENFILYYTHDEEPLSSEMIQAAINYISEDHVDGEGSEKALYEKATRSELILEDIFICGDEFEEEEISHNVYADDKTGLIYSVNMEDKTVKVWKLTKPQNEIAIEHRSEILKYRLAKFTIDDEVSLGDIFMHGKYIKEL